jgi:anthranilate synthase component 2
MSGPTGTVDGAATPSDSLAPRILVVDNYDSFAYNLVQYVGEILLRLGGSEDHVVVRRNDAVTVEAIHDIDPDGIVVSPGPGTPEDAGVSMPAFAELDYPTLGVCLGHQALCAANGSEVGHADAVVHGKSSLVTHDGEGLFEGVPDPVEVGRYHSLAVQRGALPDVLEETAHTVEAAEADIVMAVRHQEAPHIGVQFHPESILTDSGKTMVENFCLSCTTT